MRRLAFVTSAGLLAWLLAQGSAFGQLSKDQQTCINAMNKALVKVAKTQGKEGVKCVKDETRAKLAISPDACLTADLKDKVSKATMKTADDETKKCGGGAPIGYTSAATTNSAAVDNELALMHDIFGFTLDGVLSGSNAIGKCQAAVIKRVQKIVDAKLKEFAKCKKEALQGGATTAGQLESCVTPGGIAADPKDKISKAVTKLSDEIFGKDCPFVPKSTAFPGECSDGFTVGCLDALAECRVCLMINQADNLNVDCSTFSGITCPPPVPCGNSTYPTCGGTCPSGQICQSHITGTLTSCGGGDIIGTDCICVPTDGTCAGVSFAFVDACGGTVTAFTYGPCALGDACVDFGAPTPLRACLPSP